MCCDSPRAGLALGMFDIPTIDTIKAAAKARKVRMGDIFRSAGVSPSTVYRWRDGGDVKLSTVQKLVDALDELARKK